VKTVRQKRVFGAFAMACLKNEPATEMVARSRTEARAEGEEVEGLKARLLDNPKDIEAMNELARLSIAARDFYMARLILSRALEADEAHAPSNNLLGVVSFHLGEDQAAYDSFTRSLKLDSGHLPARLNLATLFARYDDEKAARAALNDVLAEARSSDLSVSDYHPFVRETLQALGIR
jgi:Flp pilus assembly protein TadD